MRGDIYPGLLLLAVAPFTPEMPYDVPDDKPLCDMDRCGHNAAVERAGNLRVCVWHGLIMGRLKKEGSAE